MKFMAYAGFRADNRKLVEALVHEQGDSPCVRLMTEDRVRVTGTNPFELDYPGDTVATVSREMIRRDLTKVLSIILMKAALTPELIAELERDVPGFKVRQDRTF